MSETTVATQSNQHPLPMLQSMIDTGSDPESLRQMMELAERWRANEAKESYNRAMTKCQGAMTSVVRTKQNTQTNSKYATLENIHVQCRPIWTGAGFTLSFGEKKHDQDGWVRMVCTVRHDDGHSEEFERSGPMDDVGMKGNPTKTGIQGVASAGSYLIRYLICGVFDIVIADTDHDGNPPQKTPPSPIRSTWP